MDKQPVKHLISLVFAVFVNSVMLSSAVFSFLQITSMQHVRKTLYKMQMATYGLYGQNQIWSLEMVVVHKSNEICKHRHEEMCMKQNLLYKGLSRHNSSGGYYTISLVDLYFNYN
jgi:hypothetical protein